MLDRTQSSECTVTVHSHNSSAIPNPSLAKRKAFGAFYTPLRVASLLANWAIRDKNDVVLEPCFGGCDFLEAIKNRFDACGQKSLEHHIYGCDIDSDAFAHLSNRLHSLTKSGNFLQNDFLGLTPAHFGQKSFSTIIGNPPYIKNDRISTAQKQSIKCLAKETTEAIKGRVNLWTYFVVHAMSFLRVGGRMALVLPDNFLTADYSTNLREALSNKFAQVTAISVSERLFLSQGTEERTVVLLCDGFQQKSMKPISVMYCSDVTDLGNLLTTNVFDASNISSTNDDYSRLTTVQQDVFAEVSTLINALNIGKLGTVYIGIVLGDKKFFVRSMSDWKSRSISDTYICPIVSKFSYLSGLSLHKNDVAEWKAEDKPCFLFNTRDKVIGRVAAEYLLTNEKQAAGGNATFNRREIWHRPDDGRIADAFIGCISHLGPRLVLNSEKVQAANSVYRFDFVDNTNSKKKKVLAIALLTTFSQLSAELHGRPLGSGGLKLEPGDISQIMVATNTKKSTAEITTAFKEIDALLRGGKNDEARSFADDFMYGSIISKEQKDVLSKGLNRIRTHRHRGKSIRNDIATADI